MPPHHSHAASVSFPDLFQTGDSARDKFLARVFGIVSEEVVRCWCANDRAPFENLGRPTIRAKGSATGHTLDFTLRRRSDGQIFVAELKCELEYENYRYLTLDGPEHLTHHTKPAFQHFLALATSPAEYELRIKGKPTPFDGAILVWGTASDGGRASVCNRFGFAVVLTVEEMVRDLVSWDDPHYLKFLRDRRAWCDELWRGLGASEPTREQLVAVSKAMLADKFGVDPSMVLIDTDPELKNWARLVLTVGGYRERFGAWPTTLRMPLGCLEALQKHELHEDFGLLQRRIQLVVDDDRGFVAEGADGAFYYSSMEGPDEWPEAEVSQWLGFKPGVVG